MKVEEAEKRTPKRVSIAEPLRLYDWIAEPNRTPQIYTESEPAHEWEGKPFNYVPVKKAKAKEVKEGEEPEPVVTYDEVIGKLEKDSLANFEGLQKVVVDNHMDNEFAADYNRLQ
jgi:hypothetical protein